MSKALTTSQFADEEVASNYVYPLGYKVKGITEQTSRLRELFPSIGAAAEQLAEQSLPTGAEGFFAIPRWQKLAPTYNKAVELVLAKIAETRSFYIWPDGYPSEQHLQQHKRTVKMFETLVAQQPNHDILVVPGQFGLRHRGRSVRRAREVFTGNEFGFGAFAVGIMLLTHPERLVHFDNLWIDFPGDEYAPGAGGAFYRAPYFYFYGDEVEFDARYVDDARDFYGSASGFLLQ